jgi:hypothetical protein
MGEQIPLYNPSRSRARISLRRFHQNQATGKVAQWNVIVGQDRDHSFWSMVFREMRDGYNLFFL